VSSDDSMASVMPEPTESETSDPQAEIRVQMMARFEQWLDQTLAGEPLPRGVPEHLLNEAIATAAGNQPAVETDLYTLFSALTALTGEIRLQGRAFKQLTDLLSPLAETPATLARLEQAIDDTGNTNDPGVSIDQVCAVMIDLYDRLQRGLQTCDEGIRSLTTRTKRGWLRRLFQNPASAPPEIASVQAIRDASSLTLARLQAAMQEWGVQRIGKSGEPFDPDCMTAVDVRAIDHVPPGTVLVVQRSGYAVNGFVKAAAQVTVSKAMS
jgi:hypothetical protein